ncbi:MAG: hypothetical protein EOO69_03525 [Moraxellaceae bacterium]|nr:MAG: hypothetical protein EOO69_03525 [Moraxellaceae bacterium]
MINKDKLCKRFKLTTLASSLLVLNTSGYALQAMTEQDLRKIDGQDGIQVSTQYDQINIDQLYWQDEAGTAANSSKTLRATADQVNIGKINGSSILPGSTITLNSGTNGTKAGLNLQFTSNPSLTTINSLKLCDTAATPQCGTSLGRIALESTAPSTISLTTTDGLFNQNSQATAILGLNSNNLYISHVSPNGSNLNNQLILKNLNFNFSAKGVIYIDDKAGLVLHTNTGGAATTKAGLNQSPNATYGYADLARVPGTTTGGTYNGSSSGLNLEFMTKADVDMSAPNPYTTTNAKGLIRVGASGRIVNGYLQVRGVDATGIANPTTTTAGNILGKAGSVASGVGTGNDSTVIGKSGIALRLRGEFTRAGDGMLSGDDTKATTLEIGGAGTNTLGFEFGDLAPLVVGSTDRAYFDSGNVYLNITDTNQLLMPQNLALNAAKFGSGSSLTTAADYTQMIYNGTGNNPYAMVLAIRGMDFQAVSKRGRFTSSPGTTAANTFSGGTNNKWGLGLPFYNVNANAALYGTTAGANTPIYSLNSSGQVVKSLVSGTQRLGLSLALSAQGLSDDGQKTTSIMVVNADQNQYVGLRNIDMLLKGTGSVGFENGNFNVNLPNLLIVMAGQLAAGDLPGAGSNINNAASFKDAKDVLFGLKLRLQGDMNFSLLPNNSVADGTKLSIVGDFNMDKDTKGNTIQISEPTDGSVLGFDNIVGKLRFNNSITISRNDTAAGTLNPGEGKVGFNAEFTFNPDSKAAEVFRVKDINLYPSVQTGTGPGAIFSTGAPQRLGEMVITGGRISSQLGIVPRN